MKKSKVALIVLIVAAIVGVVVFAIHGASAQKDEIDAKDFVVRNGYVEFVDEDGTQQKAKIYTADEIAQNVIKSEYFADEQANVYKLIYSATAEDGNLHTVAYNIVDKKTYSWRTDDDGNWSVAGVDDINGEGIVDNDKEILEKIEAESAMKQVIVTYTGESGTQYSFGINANNTSGDNSIILNPVVNGKKVGMMFDTENGVISYSSYNNTDDPETGIILTSAEGRNLFKNSSDTVFHVDYLYDTISECAYKGDGDQGVTWRPTALSAAGAKDAATIQVRTCDLNNNMAFLDSFDIHIDVNEDGETFISSITSRDIRSTQDENNETINAIIADAQDGYNSYMQAHDSANFVISPTVNDVCVEVLDGRMITSVLAPIRNNDSEPAYPAVDNYPMLAVFVRTPSDPMLVLYVSDDTGNGYQFYGYSKIAADNVEYAWPSLK